MKRVLATFLLAAFCSTAWSAPPAPYSAVIVRAADADTVVVERADHSQVKVRLFAVDAPEVKHRPREVDQPGGQEALSYVKENWLGKEVIVIPRGESYGRIVAEVSTNDEKPQSMGLDLVAHGFAEVDQRYSKSKLLLDAESKAKAEKLGLWANESPVHPWDFRKRQRARGK